MYAAHVRFALLEDADQEEAVDAIQGLLGAWWRHGQVLNLDAHLAVSSGAAIASVFLPEADALDARFNGSLAASEIEGLQAVIDGPPSVEILGSDPTAAAACSCEERSALILFTHFLNRVSPLRCAGCFLPVPLYRLDLADAEVVDDLRMWEHTYRACDELEIDSGFGESFARQNLWQLDSGLSERGRDVCTDLKASTGLPTYYYLARGSGKSVAAETKRPCPGCGGAWRLQEPLHGHFDFRCDPCLLLSNIAFDVRG